MSDHLETAAAAGLAQQQLGKLRLEVERLRCGHLTTSEQPEAGEHL